MPPCPSPSPGVHSDSCPLSQWCHPDISSSVIPLSSCPQSLPASESFPTSQLFTWGGQSIGLSALASVLPRTPGLISLEWTGWIFLQSKGLSRVFSNTTVEKHQFFSTQLSSQSNSHIHMTTGKTIALTSQTFVDKVAHTKLWKILKEMGIPDHLTCLLRNLYAGQEAIVRTRHGTTDWFQIGKGVHQGCILSPCLFNLHAEYIMRNFRLEETQAGIKISGRNINNLRHADDTTLIAESEEELRASWCKRKRRVKKLA